MHKIVLSIITFLCLVSQSGFSQFSHLFEINPGAAASVVAANHAKAVVGNTLYFAAENADYGAELWKTDGTFSGTVLVKDINPGTGGSSPAHFEVMGDKMFFTADDGTTGRELWITDGTEAGTILLADIRSGAFSAFEDWFFSLNFKDFYVFQNQLFFRAYTSQKGLELYKSDGTPGGTVLVKDIGYGQNDGCQGYFTEMNGQLYFAGFSTSTGGQIWKTDGTDAGTVAVTTTLANDPTDLATLGNLLVFVEDDGISGPEPWKSDGTAAGTSLLKNTDSATGSGGLSHDAQTWENRFFVVDNKAYFSVINSQYDGQIWVTDGTPAGTKKLKSTGSACEPQGFARLGNDVYFKACDFGTSLWKTAGTIASTQAISEYTSIGIGNGGADYSGPIHVYDNKLWFAAESLGSSTLFSTDGTAANIIQYYEILNAQNFVNLGNKLILWAGSNFDPDNLEPLVYQSPLTVSGTTTAVSCNDGNDGAIQVQTSGTAPFSTMWLPATASGLNPTGLSAGYYFLTVTDADGKQGETWFTITEPQALQLDVSSTPQIGTEPNGTASVNASGGTQPYQYAWSTTPVQTTATATTLEAGIYNCTVTDANGCSTTTAANVAFILGADEPVDRSNFSLRPNPASGQISVVWAKQPNQSLQYRLFDSTGKFVRSYENPDNDQLSLAGLPNGIFTLQIVGKTGTSSVHFMKSE